VAKISGKISRALGARTEVFFVHPGYSWSARSGLRLSFIAWTRWSAQCSMRTPPPGQRKSRERRRSA